MTIRPGVRLGRYEIRRQLGKGGMGEVYLAHDSQLDRTVALKILPADLAAEPDRMQRFVHEAKAASALNHPGILTVFEIGRSEATHFIATEFIDGVTLRDRMAQPIALRELLDIAIQAASALGAAHAAGIVHRDVKPENLMLRRDGYVKVLDFGLAKLAEGSSSPGASERETIQGAATEPGIVLGTPKYMSPEQARGSQLDPRTDIWSLGAVVYEMATGRSPFEGTSIAEQLAALLDDRDAPPLARYAGDVPAELQRIVSKALVKDRTRRYQTIRDFELDLTRLKEDLEFQARGRAMLTDSPPAAPDQAHHPMQTGSLHGDSSDVRGFRHRDGILRSRRRRVTAASAVASLALLTAAYYFATRAGTAIDSVAVLPLVNVGGDPEGDYLTEGLTESLINRLSQLPNLRVAGRNSVFRYKGKDVDVPEVADQLGVRAILTGRVTQRGDSLSITVELTDARTNSHLWGDTYNRQFADLSAVQAAISREISDALRVELTSDQQAQLGRRDTDSVEAHRLYLKGRYFWNRRTAESLNRAIEHFTAAIERDPQYALAYSGLADAYLILGNYSLLPPREAYSNARAAATKALEQDRDLAEAHTSLAFVKCLLDVNWPDAEKGFRHAIALNPNYGPAYQWYAVCLAGMGRMDDAIASVRRARDVDPLSSTINAVVGWISFLARRYDDTIKQEQITLRIDPGFPLAHRYLGLAYEQKGQYDEAIVEFQNAMVSGNRALDLGALGHVYGLAGRTEQARKVLAEAETLAAQGYFPAYEIALIHTGLGQTDRAFEWLEKAYEERYPWLIHLNVEPRLDRLRADSRFRRLAVRVGVTRE